MSPRAIILSSVYVVMAPAEKSLPLIDLEQSSHSITAVAANCHLFRTNENRVLTNNAPHFQSKPICSSGRYSPRDLEMFTTKDYRKLLSFILIGCFVFISVEVEATEGQITFGVDGNVWKRILDDQSAQISRFNKLILLRGVLDGMMYGQSPFIIGSSKVVYTNTTFEHLIDGLDQFYADYRNEKILVVWALLIVSMELNGKPREQIDAALADYRSRISQSQ